MFSKINIKQIIQMHNATLHAMQDKQFIDIDRVPYRKSDIVFNKADFLLFYLLPVLISILVLQIVTGLPKEAITLIVNTAAIFLGLMLTALILIIDRRQKIIQDNKMICTKEYSDLKFSEILIRRRIALLKEIYYNISFSMLVSLLIIVLGIVLNFIPMFSKTTIMKQIIFDSLTNGLTCIIIAAIINLLLTILMIIKRVCAVFDSPIDTHEQ